MPGMGVDLAVKVRCGRGSTSPLAEGKGAHREVGVRRKPEAKPRPDEQEPHTRLDRLGELARHSETRGCQRAMNRALGTAYWRDQGLLSLSECYNATREAWRTAGCGPACPVV